MALASAAVGFMEPWWGDGLNELESVLRAREAERVGNIHRDASLPSDRSCGRASGAYSCTPQPYGNPYKVSAVAPASVVVRVFARTAVCDHTWVADVRRDFAGDARALCHCRRFGSVGPSCP